MPADANSAGNSKPRSKPKNEKVLVLHPDKTPSLTSLPRALTLVYFQGEAILLEKNGIVRAAKVLDRPTVIQLERLVERYSGKLGLTYNRIFQRDQHTCQYCGATDIELTVDHVLPKSRGGQRTWDNLVSACLECNQKKADRTPEEAGMTLLSQPKEPNDPVMFQILMEAGDDVREVWKQYLEAATSGDQQVDETSSAETPQEQAAEGETL